MKRRHCNIWTEDKMYRMNPEKASTSVIHGYSLAGILRYVNTVRLKGAFYRKSVYDESGIIKRRTGFGQGSVPKKLYRENGNPDHIPGCAQDSAITV